jgi:Protein of unknown function (DUF4239)
MGNFGITGLWLFLALALIVAVLVAAGSLWLADRTIPKPVSEGHNGALSPFLTCVGLVYGALLGFTIVVGWEQFSSAEANVSNEASTLITMYRQTVGMPVPEQTQMRELLRKYTKAVEGPEWENAIRAGVGTESARDALNEMYRVLGSEQSSVASNPISQKFLDKLDVLALERNQRILDATPRIPGLLWTGLLFGGVVLLGLGGFMRLGRVRAHLLLLSAVGVLLGLLLFIVY